MKVYQFGLMDPVQNASIVVEQMRAAHRYRNDLIAIERGRRAAELDALRVETGWWVGRTRAGGRKPAIASRRGR